MRRARSLIMRTVARMGKIEAKRVNMMQLDIPDRTSTAWDNPVAYTLVTCIEAQDETLVSDGTNIATVPLYSKIVALKLQGYVRGAVASPCNIRWMLVKNPDQDITAATFMSSWHNSDDSTAAREVRANILAKGIWGTNESSGISRANIFVRRNTLRRLGSLRENDRITLILANDIAPATNPTITLWGTVYAKVTG